MDVLEVFLLATFTALATGFGALPVSWIGPERVRRYEPFLLGITAGVVGLIAAVVAAATAISRAGADCPGCTGGCRECVPACSGSWRNRCGCGVDRVPKEEAAEEVSGVGAGRGLTGVDLG